MGGQPCFILLTHVQVLLIVNRRSRVDDVDAPQPVAGSPEAGAQAFQHSPPDATQNATRMEKGGRKSVMKCDGRDGFAGKAILTMLRIKRLHDHILEF
jgi:hypothetical protein